MTAPRTVTVQTDDHGPVAIPEPAWCTGAGHDQPHSKRSDICHLGPEISVPVRSARGPRDVLTLQLTLWPYSLVSNAVHVAVHLVDSDPEYDSAGLDALAEDLVQAAGHVRAMARRLAVEERRGER